MSERSWQSELPRFRAMSQLDKLAWLSQLLHLISMFARDTYEVGTDGVSKPSGLRRFNELIHRVATFQKKIAMSSEQGMPDEDVFALLERELSALDVPADQVLCRLP
jgi:hypothetical protein